MLFDLGLDFIKFSILKCQCFRAIELISIIPLLSICQENNPLIIQIQLKCCFQQLAKSILMIQTFSSLLNQPLFAIGFQEVEPGRSQSESARSVVKSKLWSIKQISFEVRPRSES